MACFKNSFVDMFKFSSDNLRIPSMALRRP